MKKIAIIDYSIGNIFSVNQAFKNIEMNPFLTSKPEDLKTADAVILPGVGAFAKGMESLKASGMSEAIMEFIKTGKPFFGICLGMQLLFSESEEFGSTKGLGLVSGKVKHFKNRVNNKMPVPQIMWNAVGEGNQSWEKSPLEGTKVGTDFYFVHSYYCETDDSAVLGYTEYGGIRYCSALLKDNVFATQFHPEKSGAEGVKIYQNWKKNYL